MSLINIENIDAYYGRAKVLHGVSLEVKNNERVAILGRNGVGKTTIVNACTGIANVQSGSITFNGKKHSPIRYFSAARSGISVVPQGRRIIPNLSVKENLLLGASVNRLGYWQLETVYELFPILKERQNLPGTAMSGGQQQMLAIGRALMANPDLLILDEPSEGLAPVIVDELGDTLVKLGNAGTSILLIEQNIRLVKKVAERYYVLSKGEVVEQGNLLNVSMDELKKHIAV
jgi:ABC-type branched-subunit amino acid transport system ATPase component